MTTLDRFRIAMSVRDIPAAREARVETEEAIRTAIDCQWPAGWGFWEMNYNEGILHLYHLRGEAPKLLKEQIQSIMDLGVSEIQFHSHNGAILLDLRDHTA